MVAKVFSLNNAAGWRFVNATADDDCDSRLLNNAQY